MAKNLAALAVLGILMAPTPVLAFQEPPIEPTVEPSPSPSPSPQAVLEPEAKRPGFLKRKIDSFLSDDETGDGRGMHWGPFKPAIESVSTGSGIGPMLHFWTPDIGGSPLDFHASAAFSMNRYQYYDAQFGLLPHVRKKLPRIERGTSALFPLADLEKTSSSPGFSIYASGRYRDYPREAYYGLGPNSVKDDRSDFRRRSGLYEGVMSYRISRLTLMARGGLLQTSILAGTDDNFVNTEIAFTEAGAPGLTTSPDFIVTSGGAWLEFRDEPENAHRGVSLGAAYSRFDDRNGNAFQFNRLSVDLREYVPLGGNRNVIALRQVTSLDDPDDGSQVPFYMQSSLGRSTFLRGYNSFRFRDDKLLAFQGEYRFEIVPKVEIALLYDAAKVFGSMSEFDFQHLRTSYGAGIRLKSPKKVKLRLDVMRSVEGTRVQIKLDPSF